MNVVSYARVSMVDNSQTCENQTHDLERWIAEHPEANVVARVTEQASSRGFRPEHDRVLKMLREGQADTLLVWAVDRWGRSMTELVMTFDEAIKKGWAIVAIRDNIDLTTAAGVFQAHMLCAVANWERTRISERVRAGLARTKAAGKVLGRPRKLCINGDGRRIADTVLGKGYCQLCCEQMTVSA